MQRGIFKEFRCHRLLKIGEKKKRKKKKEKVMTGFMITVSKTEQIAQRPDPQVPHLP